MRIARYLPTILFLGAAVIAALASIAIFEGTTGFYVLAIWVVTLSAAGLLLAVFRSYQRIIKRQSTALDRLAELRFLQERRYEQLRTRLDNHKDLLALLVRQMDHYSSDTAGEAYQPTDLEALSTRLRRSERRIMGRLEEELHAYDRRNRKIEELINELGKVVNLVQK